MQNLLTWKIIAIPGQPFRLQAVHLDPPPASLNAASQALPDGVYTTFRSFGKDQVLPLEEHVKRLEESARLVGVPVSLDAQVLYRATGEAISRLNASESRLRISVDLEKEPGSLYLSIEPLHIPGPDEYEKGVAAVTVAFHRQDPLAKKTEFIRIAERTRQTLEPGVNEALMLDETGQILEGLSSNFFAVKDEALCTAGQGILLGTVRAMAIEAAERLGIPIHLKGVDLLDLPGLQEVFLTSSSRGILPVRQIDGQPVGTGQPGLIYAAISAGYWEEVRRKLVKVGVSR